MPYRRRRRFRRRRRPYRRRRRRINRRMRKYRPNTRLARRRYRPATSVIRNAGFVYPDRMFVKFRYSRWARLNDPLSPHIMQVYRGNSPYDPYYTGVGDSAFGYDQLAQIYDRELTFGSSIRVKLMPTAPTSVDGSTELNTRAMIMPTWVAIIPTLNPLLDSFAPGIVSGNSDQLYEWCRNQPYSTVRTYNSNSVPYLKSYISLAKLLGISPKAISLNPEMYGADIGSNPPASATIYWFVFYGNDTSFSVAGQLYGSSNVEITYWTMLHRRKHFQQSGELLSAAKQLNPLPPERASSEAAASVISPPEADSDLEPNFDTDSEDELSDTP